MSSTECICNDETLTKTINCFNSICTNTLNVKLHDFERTARCPLHHASISVCGGIIPSLCTNCEHDGYCIKTDSFSWRGPSYVCDKK
jgi:hypothetical protein